MLGNKEVIFMKKTYLIYILVIITCLSTVHAEISSNQQISISLLNQNPDPVEPGRYIELRFKVENLGGANAKDLMFEILPQYPLSLDAGQNPILKIGDVDAQQIGNNAYTLYYRMRVDSNALDGDNIIRLQYSRDDGKTWILLDPFTVRIRTTDYLLAIKSVTAEPAQVAPGGKIDLTLVFSNMAGSLIKNVKVNLQLIQVLQSATSLSYTELPFSPVDSTNEQVIQQINGKNDASVIFSLLVNPGATSGIYKVPVLVTYSNEFGQNFSLTQIVSIVVAEQPQLLVTVQNSEILYEGQSGIVTIKFVNKGTGNIQFLYAKLQESPNYKILNSDDEYIGKIESDDYSTSDFKLHLLKGEKDYFMLPLHVSFKDPLNKDYEQDLNLKVKLYSKDEAKNLGLETKSTNFTGIVIVLVIVVVGLFLYIRSRRKSKK